MTSKDPNLINIFGFKIHGFVFFLLFMAYVFFLITFWQLIIGKNMFEPQLPMLPLLTSYILKIIIFFSPKLVKIVHYMLAIFLSCIHAADMIKDEKNLILVGITFLLYIVFNYLSLKIIENMVE